MKKLCLYASVALLSACGNQPIPVAFTIEPAATSYPDGKQQITPNASDKSPWAISPRAYYNRGDPENYLQTSSELVTINLSSRAALSDIASKLADEKPARAELRCAKDEALCSEAARMLARGGVAISVMDAGEDSVTLVYETTDALECENRFIDNSSNQSNLHPPTFGCSVAGNTVHMVRDKRQFTDPNELGLMDGGKAVQAVRAYQKPTPPSSKKDKAVIKSSSFD